MVKKRWVFHALIITKRIVLMGWKNTVILKTGFQKMGDLAVLRKLYIWLIRKFHIIFLFEKKLLENLGQHWKIRGFIVLKKIYKITWIQVIIAEIFLFLSCILLCNISHFCFLVYRKLFIFIIHYFLFVWKWINKQYMAIRKEEIGKWMIIHFGLMNNPIVKTEKFFKVSLSTGGAFFIVLCFKNWELAYL